MTTLILALIVSFLPIQDCEYEARIIDEEGRMVWAVDFAVSLDEVTEEVMVALKKLDKGKYMVVLIKDCGEKTIERFPMQVE